jgi:hypothetical protein
MAALDRSGTSFNDVSSPLQPRSKQREQPKFALKLPLIVDDTTDTSNLKEYVPISTSRTAVSNTALTVGVRSLQLRTITVVASA